MSSLKSETGFPPGYRILIGVEDLQGKQYQHHFGGFLAGVPLCITCKKPMQLIFLFNLLDPRLSILTLPNVKKIPLVACLACSSIYEPQFFKLKRGGDVVEVVHQILGAVIAEDYFPRVLAEQPIALRSLQPNEYPRADGWYPVEDTPEPKHQIGGLPVWLQETVNVQCPNCNQSMKFAAMFNDDPYVETGKGQGILLADSAFIYWFYCGSCKILGTVFQSL
jgi:hypothetical protein